VSIRVLSWVFDHATVEHRGDLLVLLVLADHAHDDGSNAFPSVETIARKARLSERGARYALRTLEESGAITPTGKTKNGVVVYSISLGAEATAPAATAPGSEKQLGGQSVPEPVSLTAPEPSLEPSGEPSSPSVLMDERSPASETDGEREERDFSLADELYRGLVR
jgi:hypothetical protein